MPSWRSCPYLVSAVCVGSCSAIFLVRMVRPRFGCYLPSYPVLLPAHPRIANPDIAILIHDLNQVFKQSTETRFVGAPSAHWIGKCFVFARTRTFPSANCLVHARLARTSAQPTSGSLRRLNEAMGVLVSSVFCFSTVVFVSAFAMRPL